jgi:hypothetical protein
MLHPSRIFIAAILLLLLLLLRKYLSMFHPFLKATKALTESRGIALLCFLPRH